MQRDLGRTIVGRIGHPYPVLLGIGGIDGVETRADAAADADVGARLENTRIGGCVGNEQGLAVRGLADNVLHGLALRHFQADAGGSQKRPLKLHIGKPVVGEENFHGLSRLCF